MTELVYTQGCRFDLICKRTGKYSEVKASHCLHDGGTDCPVWRRLTKQELGYYQERSRTTW